jgi:hypothetical protein
VARRARVCCLFKWRPVATRVPVTAVQLKALEARRFQDMVPNTQVRIDHNSTITMVVKEAEDRLRVEFGYTTSYGALGVVKIEGALVYTDPAAAEAAETWSTTRNLPPNVAQQVHSAIMSAAVPEAVGLAKDIRLPPPIPLPQIQFQGQAKPNVPAAKPADSWGSPEVG